MKELIMQNPIYKFIEDYVDDIQVLEYKKGTYISRAAEALEEIFFILEGHVDVECITKSGRRILVDELAPNEFVGKISYFYEQNLYCDIMAKTNAVLLKIDKKTFMKLEKNSEFLKIFLYKTSKRIYFIYKKLMVKDMFKLEERFAYHLVENSKRGLFEFKSMYSLSEQLSVSRKNLYNVMNRFVENGYIEKKQHVIRIANLDQIYELSKGVREVFEVDKGDFKIDISMKTDVP